MQNCSLFQGMMVEDPGPVYKNSRRPRRTQRPHPGASPAHPLLVLTLPLAFLFLLLLYGGYRHHLISLAPSAMAAGVCAPPPQIGRAHV